LASNLKSKMENQVSMFDLMQERKRWKSKRRI
jgi:hypothetical protein